MKILGPKLSRDFSPLTISGGISIIGGSDVQFWDGTSYSPNREGALSSPLIIRHIVDVVNTDTKDTQELVFNMTTKYYENNDLITASTPKYTLLENGDLKVEKNIPAGQAVAIKAVTQFLDPRSKKLQERVDVTYLRTHNHIESEYQITITPNNLVAFDGFRNPNVQDTITAIVHKGGELVTDYTGMEFRWLNSEGKDAVEYELYGDEVSPSGRELTIDKTYIDKETIHCELWMDDVMIDSDSVTYFREFAQYSFSMPLSDMKLPAGSDTFNFNVEVQDTRGVVDVDHAFLAVWMVDHNGVDSELGTGKTIRVPASRFNFDANPRVWLDLRKRMAWAALTDEDDYLLTDDEGAVLTVETYE